MHKEIRRHCFFSDVQFTQEILIRTEQFAIFLTARYIPGKSVLTDQLSCPDEVLPAEWSLLPQVFEDICREFGCPLIDFFATRAIVKTPLNVLSS